MEKIKRINVTDQVFDIMLENLLNKTWKPGDRIPSENVLSAQLGVSRVSIKLALQKLNTLGLTETRIGDGSFVREFNMRTIASSLYENRLLDMDFQQMNDFRILIELDVIKLILLKPKDDEGLKKLGEILKAMEKAINLKDKDAFDTAHVSFHKTICVMSGNPVFIHLYDAMDYMISYVYKVNTEADFFTAGAEFKESFLFHKYLYQALCDQNEAECMHLMNSLLELSRQGETKSDGGDNERTTAVNANAAEHVS